MPGLVLKKHHHASLLHQGAAKVPLTQHSCASLAPCLWRTLILKKNNQLGLGRDGLFLQRPAPPLLFETRTLLQNELLSAICDWIQNAIHGS